MFEVMGELMNVTALSAFACVGLALIGFCMMVVDVFRDELRRRDSVSLLLAGIFYAAVNIAVFVVTVRLDAFTIFQIAYIIAVAFVGPTLMIAALVFVAGVQKRLSWLGTTGFTVWTGCVVFAHLWVIAAVSAGV